MEREKSNLTVGGRIVIAETIPAFRTATVHIYLEDVSRADAESVIIAETSVVNIEHTGRATEVPFRLEVEDKSPINPKNLYSVRVWIDTGGDGKTSAADLYSDRAYRVLTGGFGDSVEIEIGF